MTTKLLGQLPVLSRPAFPSTASEVHNIQSQLIRRKKSGYSSSLLVLSLHHAVLVLDPVQHFGDGHLEVRPGLLGAGLEHPLG